MDAKKYTEKAGKLVLKALKELRISRGFTDKEVLKYLNLQEDKRLRRCVVTALKRMTDLGLVKKNGKRFVLETKSVVSLEARRRSGSCKPKRNRKRSRRSGGKRGCSCGKKRQRRSGSRRRRRSLSSKSRCGKKRGSSVRRRLRSRSAGKRQCRPSGGGRRRSRSGGRLRRASKRCYCGKKRRGKSVGRRRKSARLGRCLRKAHRRSHSRRRRSKCRC